MAEKKSFKQLKVSCRKFGKLAQYSFWCWLTCFCYFAFVKTPSSHWCWPDFVIVSQNTLKSLRPNLWRKIFFNLYPTNIFQTLLDSYSTRADICLDLFVKRLRNVRKTKIQIWSSTQSTKGKSRSIPYFEGKIRWGINQFQHVRKYVCLMRRTCVCVFRWKAKLAFHKYPDAHYVAPWLRSNDVPCAIRNSILWMEKR